MKIITYTKKIIKNLGNTTIIFIAKLFHIDLLLLAYNNIGILNHRNQEWLGENYFVNTILHTYISKSDPVFFDIGANIGEYSYLLRRSFQKSEIYSFEPNQKAFQEISKISSTNNIKLFHLGLSSTSGIKKMFFDGDNTRLTSLYKNVITDLHKKTSVENYDVEFKSLDNFCKDHSIKHIDLMKIDTEGHELEILRGATDLLDKNNIDIIQFEFNEMNIISRVFLKDFYDILHNFNIYRMFKKELININVYESSNEIFKFQNIVAISKKIDN